MLRQTEAQFDSIQWDGINQTAFTDTWDEYQWPRGWVLEGDGSLTTTTGMSTVTNIPEGWWFVYPTNEAARQRGGIWFGSDADFQVLYSTI